MFEPVFVSYVLQAEEITLTIGQAFDLAYKKFLESGGKDVETRKQIGTLQKRVRLTSSSRSSFAHTHTHSDSVYHRADALMFLLINAELVSIDCLKSSSVDN